MKKFLKSLVLFSMLTLPLSVFAVNGAALTAVDAETLGRGGVDIGVATGLAAILNNPAGLTQTEGTTVGMTFGVIRPDIYYRSRDTSTGLHHAAYTHKHTVPIGGGAIAQKINDTFYWGMGIFSEGGANAAFHLQDSNAGPFAGQWGRLTTTSEIRVVKFCPALAVKLNDQISLGFGLDIAQAMFDLHTARYNSALSPVTTPVGSSPYGFVDINDATGFGLGWHAGIMVKPTEKWKVGLTYHSSIDFEDIKTDDAALGIPPTVFSPTMPLESEYKAKIRDFKWPKKIGLGTSYQLTDRLLIAGDIKWVNWKKAFSQLKVDLYEKDSTNPAFIMPRTVKSKIPFDWDDQFVYAVGAEYVVNDSLIWRVGYNYGKNPIPAKTSMPQMTLINEHHVTTGCTYKFNENFKINAGLNYAFRNHIHTEKSTVSPEFDESSVACSGYDVVVDLVFTF